MAKNDEPAGDKTDPRTVHGFQEGEYFPKIPRTPKEYAELLSNPDKPPQFQSAPSPEQLNPHLFPRPS